MNRLVYIVFSILLVVACTSDGDRRIFRWSDLSPKADSLVQIIEEGYVNLIKIDSLEKLIDEIENTTDILQTNPEFVAFYRALIARRVSHPDTIKRLILKAKEICDSNRHDYELHRINTLHNIDTEWSLKDYLKLDNALQYAKETKDFYLIALVANQLGILFKDLNDMESSNEYFQLAIDNYQKANLLRYTRSTQLNLIPGMFFRGDTAKATNLLRELGRDSSLMQDSVFRVNWLINCWTYLREKEAIDSLFSILSRPNNLNYTHKIYFNAMKADEVRDSGDLERGYKLSLKSVLIAEKQMNRDDLYNIYRHHADYCFKLGMPDSAFLYMVAASLHRDTLDMKETKKKIANAKARSDIEMVIKQKDFQAARKALVIWLIIAVIIIGILGIVVWQTLRYTRLKIAAEKAKTDTERNRQLLGKVILRMHEKEQSIKDLSKHIEDKIDHSDKLPGLHNEKRILALNQKGNKEMDTASQLLEQIPSELIVNLRQRIPNITPGMLQLAMLIASGVSNKEIADILGINHDSVKKRRYRLRIQLKLEHDDNLEEFLRNLC